MTITETCLQALGSTNPTTFVTYDFFEHETQSTPLCTGRAPIFDNTSQYVVNVDEAFLQYLQKGSVIFELQTAEGSSYRTLGACQVRLVSFIDEEKKLKPGEGLCGSTPLIGTDDPAMTVGEVFFQLRMLYPIEQALRLYRSVACRAHQPPTVALPGALEPTGSFFTSL